MWRAALPRGRAGTALLALAAAVAVAAAPARSSTAAPTGQIWALALPGPVKTVEPAQLNWLAAHGVTTVVAVGMSSASLNRLATSARRARLTVLAPRPGIPRVACHTSSATLRTCAALAPTPTAAVKLARRSLVDYVVVRVRTPQQLRLLRGSHALRSRIVALLPLRSSAAGRAAWRSGIAYAAADPVLDLGISSTPTASTPLGSYLALLPRKKTASATGPATPTSLLVSARSTTSVSLRWTAPTGDVSGYGVYSSGAFVQSVSTPAITLTGLQCGGSSTVAVDAFDDAGTRSGRISISASTDPCPVGGGGGGGASDALPPTAPLGLAKSASTQTSITVSWTPSTDNVGVAGYGLYRAGTAVGSSLVTAFSFSGLACGTTYSLGVDAFDTAGNRSSKTSISTATSACSAGGDTAAPSAPGALSKTGSTTTSISVSWGASTDNVGVTGYGLYRNSASAGTSATTNTTFGSLTCGSSYTLGVDAHDAAGNRSGTTTLVTATSACAIPPPPPPGGGSSANLWVDASGGSCARQASPGAWADTQACSWNQAYQAAQTGDYILVRGGNYGNVSIGPNKPSIAAPGVTFRSVTGETVVVNDLENGHIAGGTGGSNVTFVGPATARSFRSDQASNIVVDGWNVDCNGCDNEQIFHLEAANNVTVRNSEIQDNKNNSLMWVSGTNLTFENNKIHDAGLPSGSPSHTECLYAWSVTNLTLKRNHFYHCSVMDVFITGSDVASGGYIENNVFEKPWENTGVISNSAYAFHFRNGGSPSPDPSNWDFRYNTFVGPLSITPGENPVDSGGMRVIGNVFLSGNPCGLGNTTYSYNAFISGACGSSSVTNSLATYLAGFTGTGDPGTYSLLAGSVLRDRGNAANYPAQDRTGAARYSGAAPDLGAYEGP